MKLSRPILLTGMKHCGKTTIGKMLSEELSIPFEDLDDTAEELFFEESGERLSTREIFKKGKGIFQKYEYKAALRAVKNTEDNLIICSSGGGICENQEAVDILKKAFFIIYIEEDAEVLFSRIAGKGLPAFLSEKTPLEDFTRIFESRSCIYDKLADMKVIAKGRTAEEIFNEIVKRLLEENHARQ